MVLAREYWLRDRRPGFYNRIILSSPLQTKLLFIKSALAWNCLGKVCSQREKRDVEQEADSIGRSAKFQSCIRLCAWVPSSDLRRGFLAIGRWCSMPGHWSYPSSPSTGQSHSRGWSERSWTILCFPEPSPSFHSLLSMTRGWEPMFLPEGKPKDRRKKRGFCLLLVVPPIAVALWSATVGSSSSPMIVSSSRVSPVSPASKCTTLSSCSEGTA